MADDGTSPSLPAEDDRPFIGWWANLWVDFHTAGRTIPGGRLGIPLAVVILAAAIGLIRPGYHSIYGESLVVIVVFAAIGSFGRALGTVAVIVHGIADLIRFWFVPDLMGSQQTIHDVIGRIVAEGVLWLAVVYMPSLARRLQWAIEERSPSPMLGRYIGAVMGAVMVGIGTYTWSNLMPYLLRAAYKLSPLPATLQPYQHPKDLAIAVGVTFFLVTVLVRRRWVVSAEVGPMIAGLPWSGVKGFIVRMAAYAGLILLFSGLLVGSLDLPTLVVGCALGEIGAWVAGRPGVKRAVAGVPRQAIRIAGAVLTLAVVLGVARLADDRWPAGLPDSPFWPIILALAAGFPIARMAFALAAHGRMDGPSIPAAASVVGTASLVLLVLLAVPQVALADNVTGLNDQEFYRLWIFVLFQGGLYMVAFSDAVSQFTHAPDDAPQMNRNVPTTKQRREQQQRDFSPQSKRVFQGFSQFGQ